MKKFWKPMRESNDQIEEMVDLAARGKLSRRRLVTSLAALGASATAITTLVEASKQIGTRGTRPATTPQEQQNLNAHDQHLAKQQRNGGSTTPTSTSAPQSNAQIDHQVQAILEDYHPDAVVEDMLVGTPIQGHAAIGERKRNEFANMRGVKISIVDRFATGSQVVAEWIAEGELHGEFLGLQGNGQPFSFRGLTVVTRDAQGKIIRESLYYDLEEVHRTFGIF